MSFFSGLFGGADKRNENAKRNEKGLRKHQRRIRDLTNEHNDKLDAADKVNYRRTSNFTHNSNLQNWERSKEIQDFQYLSQLQQYIKSNAIGNKQLGLNAQAMSRAVSEEQDILKEAFIEQQFQHEASMSDLKEAYAQGMFDRREQQVKLAGIRSQKQFGMASLMNELDQQETQNALQKESAMVDSLVSEGTAQLGQAGKSTAKGVQANKAALQRGLMALDVEMSGRRLSANLQMAELQADASLAEMSAGINLERIDRSISNAEAEAESNIKALRANMKSKIREAKRNVKQISLERKFSDVNTKAGMMIFPERLDYDPKPRKPPERIFVERAKVHAGFVPNADQENLFSAALDTTGQIVSIAATAVTGINAVGDAGGLGNMFKNFGGGGTTPTTLTAPTSNVSSNLMSGNTLGQSSSIS